MGYIKRGILASLIMPAIAGGTKNFLNNAGRYYPINPSIKDPIALGVAVGVGILITLGFGGNDCECSSCKKEEEEE